MTKLETNREIYFSCESLHKANVEKEARGEGDYCGWTDDDLWEEAVGRYNKKLRQEAIKWIKEEDNKEFHTEPKTLIEGFMEFFNLNDEDLK